MAKLQCARLMKFIMPSVTDSPTERMNSNIPYASPSKSTPTMGPIMADPARLLLHPRLERILDVLDLVELDVEELPADLLHPADIDGLNDVAGLRIDRDRPARALPLHPLGGADQRGSIGVAAGLLQRLVDEVHPVVATNRIDIRVAPSVGLVEGPDESPVQRGVV